MLASTLVRLTLLSSVAALRFPATSQRTTPPTLSGSVTTDTPVAASAPRKGWITQWMDYLKFGDSVPPFDVLEKTMQYASLKTADEAALYYADDYTFRGSIVGPITSEDVMETQGAFDVAGAYPDLDRGIFGFTVDPNNPYRCFFFERWTGTHTGTIKIGPLIKFPATEKRVETPLHITSITWNPEGKIVYQSISPPVDRFEGNTGGSGAVFGLLYGAGVDSGVAAVGLPTLIVQQKIMQRLGFKQWSDEAQIPKWWKSAARGADPNDM